MADDEMTLATAMERYVREFRAGMASRRRDDTLVRSIERAPIAALRLPYVTHNVIQSYCRKRLAETGVTTVRQELRVIRCAIEMARRHWGLILPDNPAMGIDLPPDRPVRPVPAQDDVSALLAAMSGQRTLQALVLFALETLLNRHELLALRWTDVDSKGRVATVMPAKGKRLRTVPLSDSAINAISRLDRATERVFPLSYKQLDRDYQDACKEAQVDVRFYDLRRVR